MTVNFFKTVFKKKEVINLLTFLEYKRLYSWYHIICSMVKIAEKELE